MPSFEAGGDRTDFAMGPESNGEFVVAYVAHDEIEARALVVMLRDKGIPASAERRQASSTFVASESQTSILTRRGDVARTRALIASLSLEERERMRRAMAETVFMTLDQRQIDELIMAERLAAVRRGTPHPDVFPGDKAMIFQGFSVAEASEISDLIRARGVPAVVVGGSEASPGVLPAVYVPIERVEDAREILRELAESRQRSGAAEAGGAQERSRPADGSDAGPFSARSGRSPVALASRAAALACGAALLGYAASSAPSPLLAAAILAAGFPILSVLARLCLVGRGSPTNAPAKDDAGGVERERRPHGGKSG